MSKETTAGSGIGFFGLLTIVFITLKLIGYITWSWFWVLSPVLIPIIIICVIGLFWVTSLIINNRQRKLRRSRNNFK